MEVGTTKPLRTPAIMISARVRQELFVHVGQTDCALLDALSWPRERNEARTFFLCCFTCSMQNCQIMQKYQASDSEMFALHLHCFQSRVKHSHFD